MYIPQRRLGNTDLEISIIGYGASALGAVFNAGMDVAEGLRSVHESFKLGVNYFDTSPFYGLGQSEKVLGEALKELPRKEIVVSTKVGRYGINDFDFSTKKIQDSVQNSLKVLNVEYLDLVQCHDIEFTDLQQIITETLPALQKMKESGLVRYIGITGLPLKVFHAVLDQVPSGTIDTVLSYCHHTLFDDTLLEEIPYFESKGVGVINASPLSMGLLTPNDPPTWHPASAEIKEACKKANQLCKERNVDLAKLALYHSLQEKTVSSTLVSMPTIAQVESNLTIAKSMDLTEEESACLGDVKGLFKPVFNKTWLSGLPENN